MAFTELGYFELSVKKSVIINCVETIKSIFTFTTTLYFK